TLWLWVPAFAGTTPELSEAERLDCFVAEPVIGLARGETRWLLSMTSSPTPHSLIPGKQQIGKAVITEASHGQHHGIAEQRRKPSFAGRRAPDRDRDIGADDQPPRLIRRMQPPPHVIERRAVRGQRIRLFVDIPERDAAGPHRCHELVALPVDAAITDRAA